jgi:hypothetical protein
MPDGWLSVGTRIFVTAANVRAEETVCDLFAPGDPECLRFTRANVRRMRSVQEGEWVPQPGDEGWTAKRPATLHARRPQRVAVLIDRRCGSSCEEFLLTVRQSLRGEARGARPDGGRHGCVQPAAVPAAFAAAAALVCDHLELSAC